MSLIKHCIVDTNTDLVVNIIEYETEQTGVPPALESHLLCVASNEFGIGDSYKNGVFTKALEPENTYEFPKVADQEAQISAKASALAKLTALGLTADEVKALIA